MENNTTQQRSRLAFHAQGRRRKLIRLTPNGCFHIRFMHGQKRLLRSLGTTIADVAIVKAKQLINDTYAGNETAVRASKIRSDYPTLRAICDRYLVKYGTDERRRRTALGNICALAKVVRLGAPGLDLEIARANVLSATLVRAFEEAEVGRIQRDGKGHMRQGSELRVRTSLGSILSQAKSIFKKGSSLWYEDLGMPDLKTFREAVVTSPERPKPQPLDERVINAIISATPLLAKQSPAVYAAHLLFRFLGMRNSEIRSGRRSWIVAAQDGAGKLGVIYRPEEGFKPKKKTERWIPIAAPVLREILAYAEDAEDGYLVPAANKTERHMIVDKQHSAWAGQWIKDRSKTSYELRRYAGSLLYKKTGRIEHVQQFLGHADLSTTMTWYWYLIGDVPALEPSDFGDFGNAGLAIVA